MSQKLITRADDNSHDVPDTDNNEADDSHCEFGSFLGSAERSCNDQSQNEALVDQLRTDDFDGVVKSAMDAAAGVNAQLCVQQDGSVARADPYSVSCRPGPLQAAEDDAEAELRKMREARKKQLQNEQLWKAQGHGALRELHDEREFLEAIKPHERVVCLLDDGHSAAGDEVRSVLEKTAPSHLETFFCYLPANRAFFLTHTVELEGLPAIFTLHNGQVRRHLPPSALFEYASSSSPLFKKHLIRLLHRTGSLTTTDGGDSSGSEDEEAEEKRRRQKFRS